YRRGQGLDDGGGFDDEIEIFAASGCAAFYRRSVFLDHAGFEESFFAYLEDVDLALRLQAGGHRGYYVPRAVVYHRGGATSGGEFSPLAVRLRTRNAWLLLLSSVPSAVLFRSLPMIALSQLFWAARACAHGRLASYARGTVEV